jgi:hypothetical protein
MKKTLFLAAIAALVLGSCTKEVIDSPAMLADETSAIGFGTFLDRAPQSGIKPLATVLNLDGLKDAGFYVLAYSTGADEWDAYVSGADAEPNLMDNQHVEWSTDKWAYTPVKFWPKLGDGSYGKVSFFGYAPNGTGITVAGTASGTPTIAFATQATAAAQVDLVADVVLDKTGPTTNLVKFDFDHILSRIGFTAKLAADYDPATVTVTSLKVYYKTSEVKNNGTYTFAETDNKAAGNWALDDASFFANAADQIFDGSTSPATLTTSAEGLSADDNYLMLIPQSYDEGDVYVELEYTVAYSDGTSIPNTIPNINLPTVTSGWESGKAYSYNFTLTLDPIVFDVDISVGEWGTPTDSNIDIPSSNP